MPTYKLERVALANLRLNLNNFRYPHQASERDALASMAKEQGPKLVNLAESIAKEGLNPTDLPMIAPMKDGLYTVLEGNRRVAAMKLAGSPHLAASLGLKPTLVKRLAAIEPSSLPADILCAVIPPEDATTWIALKHTGENQGVGVVEWNGVQRARFRGESPATMVIDLVGRSQLLDKATQEKLETLPITNLTRLLGTPEARDAIGLDIKNGKLELVGPEDKVLARLAHVIADIAHGRKKVTDLDTKEQRVTYAQQVAAIPADKLPKAGAASPPSARATTKTRRPIPASRKTLIPSTLVLTIPQTRINAIYYELRSLPVEKYVNSTAAMLRVFVELSVDDYAKRHHISLHKPQKGSAKPRDMTLREKLTELAKHLEQRASLKGPELRGIRTLIANREHVLSVDSLNAYLHNKDVSPAPGDLKANWDSIERFMQALWD